MNQLRLSASLLEDFRIGTSVDIAAAVVVGIVVAVACIVLVAVGIVAAVESAIPLGLAENRVFLQMIQQA